MATARSSTQSNISYATATLLWSHARKRSADYPAAAMQRLHCICIFLLWMLVAAKGSRRSRRRQMCHLEMSKAPRLAASLFLLVSGATVDAVVVFWLQSVLMPLHSDDRGVKEIMWRKHEGTLVSDFLAEETDV
jgi:hypothetical protein